AQPAAVSTTAASAAVTSGRSGSFQREVRRIGRASGVLRSSGAKANPLANRAQSITRGPMQPAKQNPALGGGVSRFYERELRLSWEPAPSDSAGRPSSSARRAGDRARDAA